MSKAYLKCFGCKEEFRREELVGYAGLNSNTLHNYCPKCLKEKQSKDYFSSQVCKIFKLKAPGPRIWKERQRIQEKYGYTDEVIIDCLDYIYNIEKYKIYVESLCLVEPVMVEKMKAYKRQQQQKQAMEAHRNQGIIQAMAQFKPKEYIVPIRENTKVIEQEEWDPDEWLDYE